MGGSYRFMYPDADNPLAEVKIHFDWVKPTKHIAEYGWEIIVHDGRNGLSAAYPGCHQGIIRHDCGPENYRIKWNTPIFSSFVGVEDPKWWDKNVTSTQKAPVIGWSTPTNGRDALEAIIGITIHGGLGNTNVLVAERVLRSICAPLVFGPTYSCVPHAYAPELQHYAGSDHYHHEMFNSFYKDSAEFKRATRFFCRAFVPQQKQDGEREVSETDKQSTINGVTATLGRYKIIQEPHWVTDENWPDHLESDVQSVRTLKEWRDIELKWAILTSFACALRLHEGPWAGEDWQKYVMEKED